MCRVKAIFETFNSVREREREREREGIKWRALENIQGPA